MTENGFIKAVAKAISEASNPEAAAKATYELCRKAADSWGMKPDIEVSIRAPGKPRHFDDKGCWCVAFEAGPYQWAIAASLNVETRGKVLAEPYYSFDLCFYNS